MGLKSLGIESTYIGKGKDLLNRFLLPTICNSVAYDRVTSFYTVDSLLAIGQGIQSLYEKDGKMRLIIGIHSFPSELADVFLRRKYLHNEIDRIRREVQEGIRSLTDSLEKERLATIAWMIQDNLLEVKVASVEGEGIFHPKTLILTDENGDKVAAIGSPNETASGLGSNIEQLMVATSWETPQATDAQQNFFDALWNDEQEYATVEEVSEDMAIMILEALGNPYDISLKNKNEKGEPVIKTSAKMLANFFVSGDIPALYMHQERAVLDALSRWPVRVLFSDEVGLGKTFEVAATMTFLAKYCNVKKIVILTPKSVLEQWQGELHEHFGINAWRYDSTSKSYINAYGEALFVGTKNPLGTIAPDIILMSAQFARGTKGKKFLFDLPDSIMPDLLIVDEAHSARVSQSLSGEKHKTRMYSMLESVAHKIPHLILATATPMQKDSNEYHAMLKLLGLPKAWQKSRNYQTSLRLIASEDIPDTSDAYSAGTLVLKTIDAMSPNYSRLKEEEKTVIYNLLETSKETDQYGIGRFIQDNWETFRTAFIKLHPAHLLTVRNTRRSLTQVGYKFPKRNLYEESIEDSVPVQFFYDKVNRFLSEDCFNIEQILYPNRKISVGFVRTSYQQRVASSLFSCKESLERRLEKINKLNEQVEKSEYFHQFDMNSELDDFDFDDLLLNEQDVVEDDQNVIDISALKRAVGIEITALNSLLSEVEKLIDSGDIKIKRSIELAVECVQKGDAVLIFSRYTDTIEALIEEFRRVGADKKYTYGIYTGKMSAIITSNETEFCDKNAIKSELFSGRLKVMFCSDAASEGLNLQAARVLINVDVPWTPARLEQRIGRIARLGQIADEVDIYNIWYPYSIEARMYHRIQKRLDETMLAIGEFPEIVASKIKQAVLDNYDDDMTGLLELKEIRNSYQVSALEELWSPSSEHKTTSLIMRQRMMDIISSVFPVVDKSKDGRIVTYQLPNGLVEKLTSSDGMPETVSLKSKAWDFIDYHNQNFVVKTDSANRPAVFCLKEKILSKQIRHESILKVLLGEALNEEDILDLYPQMLPDISNLNLDCAIDCNLPQRPQLWIEWENI